MPKIPVFSSIGQAMAVFGLNAGRLFLWALLATVLSALGVGVALMAGLAAKAFLHIPDGRESVLLLLALPTLLFVLLCWTPLAIRINQLAVTGRIEREGYLSMVFSARSVLYLGYGILMYAIILAGWVLSFLPAMVTVAFPLSEQGRWTPEAFFSLGSSMLSAGDGKLVAAILAGGILVIVFSVLIAPLQLVFPAASVERHPSMARAYELGSHNKLRLFMALLLTGVFFAVLSSVMDWANTHYGADKHWQAGLVLLPLNLFVALFNTVVTTALPAVVYRVLSGLPSPEAQPDGGGNTGSEPTGLLGVIEQPSREADFQNMAAQGPEAPTVPTNTSSTPEETPPAPTEAAPSSPESAPLVTASITENEQPTHGDCRPLYEAVPSVAAPASSTHDDAPTAPAQGDEEPGGSASPGGPKEGPPPASS